MPLVPVAFASSIIHFAVSTTSLAVKVSPLWNVTPFRTCTRHVLVESRDSADSANAGTGLPVGSRRKSGSRTLLSIVSLRSPRRATDAYAGGSEGIIIRSVRAGAADWTAGATG